jgi:polyisoprenoid-binding protein YceI
MAVMSHAELSGQTLDTPEPGRYLISPEHSGAVIATRHLFGLGAVHAALDLRDGRIWVAEQPESSAVQARFAVSTFQSGNPARDAAVLSPRLLDAENFPTMSFISTELVRTQAAQGAQAGPGAHGQWSLRGELAVRGVTRLVEARITRLHAGGPSLSATAQAVIDRYDFGITAYRGLAARKLTIDLTVVAHREES